MYTDIISNTLEKFHSYLSRNSSFCRNHPAARVSAFWSEHFNDRVNFPNLQDFLVFRRSDFVYGIGDTKTSSIEQKLKEFEKTLKTMELFVPKEFLRSLREPCVGAPLVFQHDGTSQSTSFVLNAGTTWRISELIRTLGPKRRPLNLCEIGAGWGACAYQLHQAMDIGSYTVIDLPENLCLSSTYLSATLQDKSSIFADFAEAETEAPKAGHLYFALPPAIDNLPGRYDVILNTLSFQEMDKETVTAYFSWANRSLAEDGILISFNSHDKEGVKRPSEYLTDDFSLLHLQPFRKVPAGFFNTVPYEMVFARKRGGEDESLPVAVDALGEMMQLGLDADLAPTAQRALWGQLDSSEKHSLALIREVFYPPSEEARKLLIDTLVENHRSSVSLYLRGNFRMACGDFSGARLDLEQCLELGLKDFAKVRARTMLALIYQTTGESGQHRTKILADLEQSSAGLSAEIAQVIETENISSVQTHICRVLDCPVGRSTSITRFLKRIKRLLNGR
jgi:putative sugar O-methyltransferase